MGDSSSESDALGKRKGRAPVGEAWLFEGTVTSSIPMNFRYVYQQSVTPWPLELCTYGRACHFKQPGLNEGAHLRTPSSVVKMYRAFLVRSTVVRCGSSFEGYVLSGN